MTASMIKPMGYLLLRWRSMVALLGGILAAMAMLLFVSIQQSGAQTTPLEPGPHFIAAGDFHSVAVKGSDGTVYSWGYNPDGRLGNGSTIDAPLRGVTTPEQVVGTMDLGTIVGNLTDIQDVAAGETHTLAIKTNGAMYSWGDNDHGQLGDGGAVWERRSYPGTVWGPCGESVAAGEDHSLALGCAGIAGTVWSWGSNQNSQLGIGPQNTAGSWRTTPVQVKGPNGEGYLTDVKAIAAGDNYNLAIVSDGTADGNPNDGTVWAWGENYYGQLGLGDTKDRYYPVQVHGKDNDTVNGLTDVQAIAAGHHHSLAVKSDGTVWAWGGNDYGQLGVNSDDPYRYPVQVHGVGNTQPPDHGLDLGELTGTQADLAAVAAGEHHSLALSNDGTAVYAWGGGGNGQLGVNSNNKHEYPVQVHGPGNSQPPDDGLSGITDVAAGVHHSLALKSDGSVWAWGGGAYGQLGVHSDNDHYYPVQVHGVGNVGFLTGIGHPTASGPPGGYPPDEHPPDVAICHKRGTPQAKTFYVPSSKAERLLNKKGYTEGACEE